jgi:plasmid stability protein
MPLDVSIPEPLADALRRRAARHHRTVDEEVVGILESSLDTERRITPKELLAKVRSMGLHTPSESVAIIREDRDGGHGR